MIRLDQFMTILNGVGAEVQADAERLIERWTTTDLAGARALRDFTVQDMETGIGIEARAMTLVGPVGRRKRLLRIAAACAILLAADECERGSETIERESHA